MTTWAAPLSPMPAVASGFDLARVHPVHGDVRPHTGVDYAVAVGTPVYAAAAGVVVRTGFDTAGGAGLFVGINHTSHGTRYYHLSRLDVAVGDRVRAGQRIALSGNTGTTTGPHLHFEIRTGNYYGEPVDPVPLLGGIVTDLNLAQHVKFAAGGRVSRALNGLRRLTVGGGLGYTFAAAWQTMNRLPGIDSKLTGLRAEVEVLARAVAGMLGTDPDLLISAVHEAARNGAHEGTVEAGDELVEQVLAGVAQLVEDHPQIDAAEVARLVLAGFRDALAETVREEV